ncbi:MAG: AAA family ATPase [Tissierellia bacterium]|nr:AAA family ATPase [Tissierellia bacterium]
MKFTKVTIEGFKNIKEIEINFEQLTALVAVNNYGKSNALQAIDFGFIFLQSGLVHRKRMISYQGVPENEDFYGKCYRFSIQGTYDNNYYKTFRYSFGFDWISKKINFEKLEFLNENANNQFKTLIERNKNNNYSYMSKIDGSNKRRAQIDEGELLIDKIREDEVDYYDVIKFIKSSKYRYCKEIDVTQGYNDIPLIAFDDDFLLQTPKKLALLKKRDPERYSDFLFILRQLFPDVVDIITQIIPLDIDEVTKEQLLQIRNKVKHINRNKFIIEENQYVLRIKVRKLVNPLNINQMSNGFKRVVWLLLNILEANQNNIKILAIEELETGIHQKLLRNLLEKIYDWIDNDLILLISTHSAELVSYLNRGQIVIGVPNENMEAKFIQLSEKSYKIISRDAQVNKLEKANYIFELINNYEDPVLLLEYLGVK